MKMKVQSIHFDADQKLLEFIQKKGDKLDQFCDCITSADVVLKLEKSETEDNKISEIKIAVPGQTLFSKGQDRSFEAATDKAIESIRAQLIKFKEKHKEHASNHKAAL